MRRRTIRPIADFRTSLDALGSPHAVFLVHALLPRIAEAPERAPLVAGANVRALHTRGFGDYPPLMLFYSFDEEAVYPLHVQPSDLSLL